MRIALIFSTIKPDYLEFLEVLLESFQEHGVIPAIELEHKNALLNLNAAWSNCYTFHDTQSFKENAELVICLGGDGTFLKTVLYVRDSNIPILGINMGRLGFLTNVNKEKIREAITNIVENKYQITERTLIQLVSEPAFFGENNFALNELAIHKKDSASMISVEVHVGDEYLNNYWADGLIISTPTGSTGYSLSCGGPIVSPETPVFIITPIAPHNLNVRPIIIKDDLEIRIRVNDRNHNHLITLDSRSEQIEKSVEFFVRKSPFTIHTVQFNNFSFYDTIRDKLLWGLDRRN